MKTARILHVASGLGIDGAGMMLYKLLASGQRSSADNCVVGLVDREPSLRDRLAALGVPTHFIGMGKIPSPAAVGRLVSLTRRFGPDLIQGWMYHGNVAASLAGSLAGVGCPVLWSVRQGLYRPSLDPLNTRLMIRVGSALSGRATRIIYNSQSSADQHEAIGYRRDRRVVIPNGFDCDEFRPDPESRESLRKELGLASDALIIGLVGRYHPIKGHDLFLQAAARLHGRSPEVHFVLVGPQVNASNPELARALVGLGIGERVHLLGQRSDIAGLTAGFDVSTCCSHGEAFANVLGEAMACGVPCAVTDVGDSARILAGTGRVVPPRDPEALAQAWSELIAMGAAARTELGLRARQVVHERYRLEAVAGLYASLHREVLGGGCEPARVDS